MGLDDKRRSLAREVREANAARNLNDPRIDAIVIDVRMIRTEIRGMNQSGNLALGNSREAVESLKGLTEVVMVQADTITGLQIELREVRSELLEMKSAIKPLLETVSELIARVERQGAWINSQVEKQKPPGKQS